MAGEGDTCAQNCPTVTMAALQHEVLALIHAAAQAQHCTVPPGATSEEVAALGQRLGMVIPFELRELLLLCNAPNVGLSGIFGIAPAQPFLDIETMLQLYLDVGWADQGWLPIAGDGCGSYYVLATQVSSPTGHPVYFVDERDYTSAAYVCGSELWHFLRFLLTAESLNADDYDTYWPYNKSRVLTDDPDLASITNPPLPWDVV